MPQSPERKRQYTKEYISRQDVKARRAANGARWRSENQSRIATRGAKRRLEKRAMCLIASARTRARNKSLQFDLDSHVDDVQQVIDEGFCQLSGIPFDLSPGRGPRSPSLDRIDPVRGYVYDNVRIICHALNSGLGDWGEDEFAIIVAAWMDKRDSDRIWDDLI